MSSQIQTKSKPAEIVEVISVNYTGKKNPRNSGGREDKVANGPFKIAAIFTRELLQLTHGL